ncbi:MAG TPA: HD domain-containing protein [Gammaproteobacteria bacterium]|nr:HD domain-containing protein [Gammaproteobacteria bacterium]
MALIGVNILLLGLVGYMEFAGLLAASLPENNTSLWLVISVNFVLLEIITVASLGRLLDSLETTLFNLQTKQSEIVLTQEATIETVASLAEYRDNETGNHIRRTQNYVRALAVYLSDRPEHRDYLDEETIELLYKSAPLHDIGKVGIPDQILLKPGKLTGEEFEEMKKHAVYGRDALLKSAEKLGNNNFLELAALIAYSHHEKWDGSGYPQGLAGKNIPLAGRIMAVADVYDALISRRVYKQAMSHRQAIQYISENRGTHFDPDIVDAVICLQQQFLDIADRFADSEDERRTLKAE